MHLHASLLPQVQGHAPQLPIRAPAYPGHQENCLQLYTAAYCRLTAAHYLTQRPCSGKGQFFSFFDLSFGELAAPNVLCWESQLQLPTLLTVAEFAAHVMHPLASHVEQQRQTIAEESFCRPAGTLPSGSSELASLG